ncbi:MAG TPA: S8 family serine peptidase [Candidatus Dormibacteraeota bacterium]|nr:S8 family serine peptidase [Candidatus Dormibacteraeota bacterium]
MTLNQNAAAPPPRSIRTRAIAAALAALGLTAVTVATGPAIAAAATPSGSESVIVQGRPGMQASVDAAIVHAGGRITRELGIINGAAATVPLAGLPALSSDAAVLAVTPDGPVHLQSDPSGYSQAADTGSAYNTTLMTGAQAYWQAGYTGRGIDIAIIDSGVVPVNGLTAPNKVLYGPDLSPESQSADRRGMDGFGHGTHLAGLIGGRDDAATAGHYAGDSTDFLGMAPDARIISVKVADSSGVTDVTQVLAGIDWVVQHAHDPGMNIRVLNMSFSTDSTQAYLLDPLAYATETAWHLGIVVTAAAGNAGHTQLADPAFNPYIIAVGAADTHGTNSYSDDTVAGFSQGGDGNRNPDLVAPGVHLESLRDPGSLVDAMYTGGLINNRFFRGSGTSQAAAIVAGAAALLLQQHPLLTNDQVKSLLTSSATPLAGQPRTVAGSGELNLRGALYAIPPLLAIQLYLPGTGCGSIEGARGSVHVTDNGVTLQGETDIMGNPVATCQLASLLKNGTAWIGGVFNGVVWTGVGWIGAQWASAPWTGNSFAGDPWSGGTWSGGTWSGGTWSGGTWSGGTWSGGTWSGGTWSGGTWSGGTWSGGTWSGGTWSGGTWSSAGWA